MFNAILFSTLADPGVVAKLIEQVTYIKSYYFDEIYFKTNFLSISEMHFIKEVGFS